MADNTPPLMCPTTPKRLIELDLLRAIAVLLVLGRHVRFPVGEMAGLRHVPLLWRLDGWIREAVLLWRQCGWIGVDLFFVLSGFLISGLLFREYMSHGQLRIGRFYVRRGLKIYPAFYALLATTLVLGTRAGFNREFRGVLAELFFVQNYVPGLWNHTWSLAVEEHFYLLLPLLLLVLIRRGGGARDPFRGLPRLFAGMAALLLALRVMTIFGQDASDLRAVLLPTHLRVDSLMFGVLLSYYFHFHRNEVSRIMHRYGIFIWLVSLACMCPSLLYKVESVFMHTAGLTLLYLGFGGLLIGLITWEGDAKNRLVLRSSWLARIGLYSYSIYLWHMPVNNWLLPWIRDLCGPALPFLMEMALYVAGSVILGMAMAKLIEFPVLCLRDQRFPSRVRPGKDQLCAVKSKVGELCFGM